MTQYFYIYINQIYTMLGLCKYKNMFGRPGKGIHRFRIANIAIVDVVATIVLAYVLRSVFFKKHNYWTVLAMCFLPLQLYTKCSA